MELIRRSATKVIVTPLESAPDPVVTTITAIPELLAGVKTVIVVSFTTVREVPAVPPKVTLVAPVKFVPVKVTKTPPFTDDEFGVTLVTVGVEALGVTAVLADEADESPVALRPITEKVYADPFVKPVTEQEVDEVVHVKEPGVDVTT